MTALLQSGNRSILFRYSLVLFSVAGAVALHGLLLRFAPGLHFPYPFLYVLGACITAWYGGYIPGLLACLIPIVGVPIAVRPFYRTPPINVAGLIELLVICLLVSFIEQTQRRARESLGQANQELDERVHDRTRQLDRAIEQLRQEIAEHRETEAALEESEDRAEFALEAAHMGRLDLDLSTGVANRSLRHDQIFGYETLQPEWTYEILLQHVITADRTYVEEQFNFARAGASASEFDFRIERQDGEIRWLALRAKVRRSAKPSGEQSVRLMGIVTDITDRKLSEQKLRTQLERMRLLDQITRAIGERQDLGSVFQVVVAALEDNLPVDFGCVCLYDVPSETLSVTSLGKRAFALAAALKMEHGAKIPIDQNGLSRCVRGQLVYESDLAAVPFSFPQRLAGGGLLAMVAAPLLVESQVFGILIAGRTAARSFSSGECEFLRQVTEHVALAAQQAQIYSALQRAYDDLRQSQQAVMQQERLRALGQMASGIGHDINNAILPVGLYAESLLETEPSLSERARRYLQTIQRAAGDVAQTVARMSEFYRRKEPQLTLHAVDLGRIVKQVVEFTRPRWSDMPQKRGGMIHLRLELASGLPPVAGIESEIREALTNLVFNALDAMPEGGTLTLRTKAPEADSNGSGSVALEVSDSGIGMDEETRRRCLEPFFTTKGERGTGLGLAMVYGIVERHNAKLEIESQLQQGTTVRLRFPLAAMDQGTPRPVVPQAVPARMRILVVDDDPLVIKSLRDTLEFDGHHVVSANGGREGIAAFEASRNGTERFSMIITDLGMPDVDGRKVASAIKSTSPSTPVILLTGWGQRLVAEEGLPENVDLVLNKPPKLRELRAALAELARTA